MELAFVPVALDALRLTQARRGVGPLAQFDRLPWTDGRADHNADRPWLGQSVQRPAFQQADWRLGAGVHLHWTLPDGLTRAAPGQAFPVAPDRWMIRRTEPGAPPRLNPDRTWIVESDHLDAAGPPGGTGVVWPADPAPGRPPFARLGRALPLKDWLAAPPPALRQRVTAMGAGDPVFAAFYPSCNSVFGFHDATAPAGVPLSYEVIGWYGQPDEDPLGGFLATHGLTGGKEPAWDALHRFGWRFSDLTDADDAYRQREPPPPGRTVCFARLDLAARGDRADLPPPMVVLADSGTEALPVVAAADQQVATGPAGAAQRAGIEAAMAALHLVADFASRQVDRAEAFAAARHEKTFLAEPGGHVWTLRAAPGAPPAGGHPAPPVATLPPTLAGHLEDLNLAQAAFDRATEALASLRARTFADWSKYALASVPAPDPDAPDVPPDPDAIRAFIETADLAAVAAAEAALGVAGLSFDADGAMTDAAEPGRDATLADRVAAQAIRSLRKVGVFNATGLSGRRTGEPVLETAPDGSGHLLFNGYTHALALDWIEGWGGWPRLGDAPDAAGGGGGLGAITVWLRLRPDAVKEAAILSFDARAHFAVELVKRDDGVRFAFRTCDPAGNADLLVAETAAGIGDWVDLVATYSSADGRKRLFLGDKLLAAKVLEGRPRLGGDTPRLGVLGADSGDDDRASAAGVRRFKGAVARLVVLPGQALEASELAALLARPRPAALRLARGAAPRFWRPRDPVVMLQGAAARASDRHQQGELRCFRGEIPTLDALTTPDRRRAPQALGMLAETVAALARRAPDSPAFRSGDGAPWHPILMEWETALHPMTENGPHGDGRDRYGPDFITAAFALDPEGPEFVARPGTAAVPDRVSISSGRAVLTPFAARAHETRRKAALQVMDGRAHPFALLPADFGDVQSQALGGFHAALLQHREAPVLPPDEPLAFAGRRGFSREAVRAAVGRQGLQAASPDQPFLPIRAGQLELRRLRLIDAFGQVLDIPLDHVGTPARLTHAQHPAIARLPPRLAQPARLNFRWLSADRGVDEMNDHPDTTPVCGWLMPNALDAAIQVHDAAGRMLGTIAATGTQPWQPVPGEAAAPEPETLANPALGRVVRRLLAASPDQRLGFLDTLRAALETIHPALDTSPEVQSLILGRPLAILRASLSLQLRGLPAINHDWAAFARDLNRRRRDDAGFTDVRFPVRLGEYGRLEDGLVGFWREDAAGLPQGPFHTPALDVGSADGSVIGRAQPESNLLLTLAGEPVRVTLLVDPMGAVHATSGILPVKAIRLPPDQYAGALARIGSAVLTGPVLAPGGRIALPLPALPGLDWAWADRDGDAGGRWRRVAGADLAPPRTDGAFEGPAQLREGWLVLNPARRDGGGP